MTEYEKKTATEWLLRAGIALGVGFFALVFWANHPDWLQGTANVQQVREAKGVTRVWMNDGTVWESEDSNAPLLAGGDEIRYEYIPGYKGNGECKIVDRSRPGLSEFLAVRVVGDPKRQSCPTGSSDLDGRVSFDPSDPTLENWTSESEPSLRVSPEGSSCPLGYKAINHLSGVGGYVRHIDCVPH